MYNKFVAASLIVITTTLVGFYPVHQKPANANTTIALTDEKPRIQIAILLDTSSSMSGLIDQTRNQLWQIVNEFSKAKRNGVSPALEVAVYEYGNNQLSAESGYVRQVSKLTGELDQVSEALFSLTTNGGDEYCGAVINTAVMELNWSASKNDIKSIFIAGNEPFSQGPIAFSKAITAAKSKGITVNTIHAGNNQTGIQSGWKQGALIAGGEYLSIDHNHRVAHIAAPQDKKIEELNTKLNQTYVPYGKEGSKKMQRQATQDQKSKQISSGLMAKRAHSKATSLYDNSSWDLVDALGNGKVKIESLEEAALPASIQKMDMDERKDYIETKAKERKEIQLKIQALSKKRDQFVNDKKDEIKAPSVHTINDAVSASIRKQGSGKNYTFGPK